MTETGPPEFTDEQVTQLASFVAEQLESGTSKESLVDRLARGGVQYHEAVSFVDEIDRIRRTQRRNGAHNSIIWGIVILAVAGAITVGSYIAAAPGGTYLITWGAMIWGGIKILTGLANASNFWRALGLVMAATMVGASLFAFLQSNDQSAYWNTIEVGDCLSGEGLPTDCDTPGSYVVLHVKRYPDDIAYPGTARFEADSTVCPGSTLYFSPTLESWNQGDRSLQCVSSANP